MKSYVVLVQKYKSKRLWVLVEGKSLFKGILDFFESKEKKGQLKRFLDEVKILKEYFIFEENYVTIMIIPWLEISIRWRRRWKRAGHYGKRVEKQGKASGIFGS
ncbi:hypothetical protein HPP92_019278 [Vanilla planifolia]|uniref:Uncharacterized protein n=1 Tax=Vanilla planifolia TaxID=51239 RepID=A0A835UJ64_VANPL|nr:hypothetical protein HPP92_019278 [Vanilla planifolia]